MLRTSPAEKPAPDLRLRPTRPRRASLALLLSDMVGPLVDQETVPALPDWSYRRWWQVLQYPDLGDRAQAATRELGRQRDHVLAHPDVRAVVEWAGRRRRLDPAAGAAGALVALRAVQVGPPGLRSDPQAAAQVVVDAVDRAVSLRVSVRRRDAALLSPERVAAGAVDDVPVEHPRLGTVVRALLRLAGADPSGGLPERVTGAVVQAADWWAAHAVSVPAAVDGPGLPGIVAALELRPSERLVHAVGDVQLVGLVAGPHPGRGRPCQVAWRRGLTYWTAVRLAGASGEPPPAATVRWWRTQLAALGTQRMQPATAALLRTQLPDVS